MEPFIKVENICKTFSRNNKQNTEVLKGISFQVNKGECLGIVGESGSGKSTLARIMLGLIPATDGKIIINGEEQKGIRLGSQMVFQNPNESFNPRKTIGYGVGEGLKNKGVPQDEIDEKIDYLFDMCGLQRELKNKYPHQISGGQCQRAAIARALAMKPDILVCDEATSALDVTVQKQVIELLQELRRKQNLTIIFISHNMALVEMFCDRAILIENGTTKRTFGPT